MMIEAGMKMKTTLIRIYEGDRTRFHLLQAKMEISSGRKLSSYEVFRRMLNIIEKRMKE